MPSLVPKCFTIGDFRQSYLSGMQDPAQLFADLWDGLHQRANETKGDPAWIYLPDQNQQGELIDDLLAKRIEDCPLWGIPFAVKDNIDIAGWPTTAACEAYKYIASEHATVVQALIDAGAVPVGKTNLDQFATGLVGTRSPFGWVPNTFSAQHISGGSSSGSASVVARGLTCFALGTDTAGSGRIPAGFNNLVGMKPTPGLLSTRGVVPACQTLDCVSVMALTVEDAAVVFEIMATYSAAQTQEPRYHPRVTRQVYSFPPALRVGVPRDPDVKDSAYAELFKGVVESIQAKGLQIVPLDMTDMDHVANLLYSGPWVAERYITARDIIESDPSAMDPTVLQVISNGKSYEATDTFVALYKVRELAATINQIWKDIDVFLVPTAPSLPTYEHVVADPVVVNSSLGRYTNFVNLLGWSALATPAGFTSDGLPFGVTWIAPGGADHALLELGQRWQLQGQRSWLGCRLRELSETDLASLQRPFGAHPVAVVGAHLSGMPLNAQLQQVGARLIQTTKTASNYRLYALANTSPAKPGLCRVAQDGAAIEVEIYDVPDWAISSFLGQIPSPLGLGQLELVDGTWVTGFVCEPYGLGHAQDITHFGGWRNYISSLDK